MVNVDKKDIEMSIRVVYFTILGKKSEITRAKEKNWDGVEKYIKYIENEIRDLVSLWNRLNSTINGKGYLSVSDILGKVNTK